MANTVSSFYSLHFIIGRQVNAVTREKDSVMVVSILYLDLYLPVQSVPMTGKFVSLIYKKN